MARLPVVREVRVVGRAEVTVRVGRPEAWKVELRGDGGLVATSWIAVDSGRPVRLALPGAGGARLTPELAS